MSTARPGAVCPCPCASSPATSASTTGCTPASRATATACRPEARLGHAVTNHPPLLRGVGHVLGAPFSRRTALQKNKDPAWRRVIDAFRQRGSLASRRRNVKAVIPPRNEPWRHARPPGRPRRSVRGSASFQNQRAQSPPWAKRWVETPPARTCGPERHDEGGPTTDPPERPWA